MNRTGKLALLLTLPDESLTVEEQILKRERLAAIRNKVNALPERQRVAVIMPGISRWITGRLRRCSS